VTKTTSVSSFSIENTLLYKKYAEEKEHILRNKWYMSEKAGYDVGYERAFLDWLIQKANKRLC
jgi:hypothetical protein